MNSELHGIGGSAAVPGRHGSTLRDPSRPHDAWRVHVTGEDVRRAWDAWWAARCADACPERVDELRDDLLRLARARVVQG